MSVYCTQLNLLDHISATNLAILTGDPTGTTIDDDRVDAAIDAACAIIDEYLSGRYLVPLPASFIDATSAVRNYAIDLTIYNLYQDADMETQVPNTTAWRRINAVADLKRLRSGELSLDAEPSRLAGLITVQAVDKVKAITLQSKTLSNDDMGKFYDGI